MAVVRRFSSCARRESPILLADMGITVREAVSAEDRQSVFRLRYEIYVEEMGRKQTYADHDRRSVEEPFDEGALLLMAEDDGRIVGTLRCNMRRLGRLECEELYDMENFAPFYPDAVSMTTKLMVRQSHRNTSATGLLVTSAYDRMRAQGIRLDFIDTNPHLVRLYQQMGYRMYKDNIDHPDYGSVIPMVFILDDMRYLEAIQSPFRRQAKRYKNGSETWEFFKEKFGDYAYIRPSFASDPEQLLSILTIDKHRKPNEVLTFLQDFNQEETGRLLNQLDLIQYRAGETVFMEGDEGTGMFCILEGRGEVIKEGPTGKKVPVAILNAGEIFGELGFVAHTRRSATVRVRADAKIFVLSPSEFRKMEVKDPRLAVKLLTNLFKILVTRFNEKSQALLDTQAMLDSAMEGL